MARVGEARRGSGGVRDERGGGSVAGGGGAGVAVKCAHCGSADVYVTSETMLTTSLRSVRLAFCRECAETADSRDQLASGTARRVLP